MTDAHAYAAASATAPLAATKIPRRDPTPRDVAIDILFCGVCHSDVHLVRNEWTSFTKTRYPIVPGHEIVGRVTAVGAEVTKHKVGDLVGVGCMVDSDRTCPACQDGQEQFCANSVMTYNGIDKHLNGVTYGGYSTHIVVDEHFVLRVPENLDPAGAAPLLCAGITTYSPMRRWGDIKGKTVGVVGLGGLGHMGVKFAKAFGARVIVFTTSPGKRDDAMALGADEVVISRDAEQMKAKSDSCHFILDTVSASHDVDAYLKLLRYNGVMTLVGLPNEPMEIPAPSLVFARRALGGSLIGGIAETQEMLDFCGAHGITATVEVIPVQEVNEAYDRLVKSDVKYRFSIDMASLAR